MKKIIPLCILQALLLVPLFLFSQKVKQQIQPNEDFSEILYEKYDSLNIIGSLQKQVGSPDQDIKEFSIYYQDSLWNYKNQFILSHLKNNVISYNELVIFLNQELKKYISLYNTFEEIKKEYPSSISEVIHRSHAPTLPSCNTNPCDNLGFENGNLSGWTGGYLSNNSSSTAFSYGAVTYSGPYGAVTTADNDPTVTGQHPAATNMLEIMSGAGTDPITGLPVVCPVGGKYSCRIGDSNVPGSQIAVLTNTFMVTKATCNFTYYYAVVLQNPTAAQGGQHTSYNLPFFNLTMFDQNGDTIPHCGNYQVVANGAQNQGFDSINYTNPIGNKTTETYYNQWTSAFVPLEKYIGQCVSVYIEVSDCAPGGHFGYAYFDATCAPLEILTSSPAICGNPITLTAPTAAAYTWSGPCIIGPTNTQAITVGCAGKYTVILQSIIGSSCADTLDTVIVSSVGAAPVPFFKADTVCLGKITQFTNLTNPSTGNTYTWNFGDPGSGINDSSHLTNPVHTFPAVGTYTVNLSATASGGGKGCGGDTNIKVIVNGNAVAGFKASTVCLNNPTVFTDTSQGASSWRWNFGETSSGASNTSTAQNPSHTYATAGTFTVTQIAGTGPCSDTSIQTIVVNPLPTALFKYTAACFGQTTSFTDESTIIGGNITTWSWNFGDPGSGASNISALQNPTHTYSAPGTYPVILTVTSNLGCQSTSTINIVVSAVPVAAFNATTVCQGHTTQFTDNSTVSNGTINSWNWNFGDAGTSTLQNPAHTYALPGSYAVTLIVSTVGCGDTVVDSVKVNPVPIPTFLGTTVCQGDTTVFTNSSTIAAGGTIASWVWSFGDLSTSNIQNPTHLYASSGTYTVSLTVTSNTGCDSTLKSTVVVNPLPVAAFSATTPCAGTATQFTDGSTISSGIITNWNWSFGDGGTSILQNPSHFYNAAGTYTVTLKITSNDGCTDSITKNVIVNPNPVPGFFSDTAGCVTLCVKFNDSSKVAPPSVISTWLWNFGDGTTDSNTAPAPAHCYKTPGTYSVSLTVSTQNGCTETFTRPNYITAWPLPVAGFNAAPNPTVLINDPTVYFTNTSTGNPVGWTWETFGDGLDSIKLTENTTHTYQDTGTFYTTLIVVNKYGCVDSVKEPIVVKPVWTFYVPNAFTPNGDGINDYFVGKGIGLLSYEMWIFDRWGMLLYHCTDINKPWDGKVQNSSVECQEDTYVYLIVITDVFHSQHRYVGKVSIIK